MTASDSSKQLLAIDYGRVAELCERWRITQLSLFGSLGRSVDLVEEKSLKNPFRRRELLRTRQVLYAA